MLEVRNLKTYFYSDGVELRAVDDVSFHVAHEETLGVVGESGCGKSVTALSIMRLIPDPPGKIVGGDIIFRGSSMLRKTQSQMRQLRGNDIAMIFQEPMTSLNPVFACGEQIAEAFRLHQGLGKGEALDRATEMLRVVGIAEPKRVSREYPHQLSGGMRQRVMIAMSMSCHPQLLIADEPTTALDVTVQAQILELIKELMQRNRMALILITHDLGVVAKMASRVIVMYAGKVVEESDVVSLFRKPLHPYSEGLMDSIPRLHRRKGRLHVIPGQVPDLARPPSGCRFHPRCPYVEEVCGQREPEMTVLTDGRRVRCWIRGNRGQERHA